MTLIPSYDLEIKNYKEKLNLLTFNLSLEARLQDWECVRHLTCLVKPTF